MQSTFTNPEFISLLGLLFVSGAFAGLLAGLFGVGGGIVLVPALLYAFDELGYSHGVTTQMAVGTSLAIIVPTSITSAWSHYKLGSVNIILFRKLAFPVVSGAPKPQEDMPRGSKMCSRIRLSHDSPTTLWHYGSCILAF